MTHPTRTSPARVAFVVPCFNHGRFVRDAVASALVQEEADVSVVVVNDGSTDALTARACDRCEGPRVRVIHQANAGLPAARNRGVRESEGEFLVFLDADDLVRPAFVRRLVEEFDAGRRDVASPGEGLHPVSHAYCQEELAELGTGVWRVPEWDPDLLLVTNLHPVTALVSRAHFERAGGFDETMRDGYEDWELWIRFAERGWRGVRVREPLFVWRRHADDTMVMRVIHRHEALLRAIMARHADLYARRAPELFVRANVLLRAADANWLDEDGTAIPIRDLRRASERYERLDGVRLQRKLDRGRGPLSRLARRALAWLARDRNAP